MTHALDVAAAEFFRAPSEDVLARWRTLATVCIDAVGNDGSRARLAAHRALLAAISREEVGNPDARRTWAARLGSHAGSVSHQQALLIVQGLAAMLIAALTPAHRIPG